MSDTSISHRRRIIYSALASHLKPDRLLEALWLWEQKYSLTSGLELRKFVSDIIMDTDEPDLKSKVYKSLTKATYFPGNVEMLPDPYDAMQQYRTQCNGTFKYISGISTDVTTPFSTVVFQRVLYMLLLQIKRENSVAHEKIIRQLSANLSQYKSLEAGQRDELWLWLRKKCDNCQLYYPDTFMSLFIADLYIICCEMFGPILADKMLAKSIRDAEDLEEAKFFNHKRLL